MSALAQALREAAEEWLKAGDDIQASAFLHQAHLLELKWREPLITSRDSRADLVQSNKA